MDYYLTGRILHENNEALLTPNNDNYMEKVKGNMKKWLLDSSKSPLKDWSGVPTTMVYCFTYLTVGSFLGYAFRYKPSVKYYNLGFVVQGTKENDPYTWESYSFWLRGKELNLRPLCYELKELTVALAYKSI